MNKKLQIESLCSLSQQQLDAVARRFGLTTGKNKKVMVEALASAIAGGIVNLRVTVSVIAPPPPGVKYGKEVLTIKFRSYEVPKVVVDNLPPAPEVAPEVVVPME